MLLAPPAPRFEGTPSSVKLPTSGLPPSLAISGRRSVACARSSEPLRASLLAQRLDSEEINRLAEATELAEKELGRVEDRPTCAPARSRVTGRARLKLGERAALSRQTLLRAFARRREILADSYSATEVGSLLGTTRQTAHDRFRARKLLAAMDGGQWRFPAWQFDPAGPDGLVDGLPAVLEALDIPSDLARIAWFLTSRMTLGGATALEALRSGAMDDVIAEARAARTG